MSADDKLIEDLSLSIYNKYDGLTSREHIKNAINMHIGDFYKSVVKSAVLIESTFSLSTFSLSTSSDGQEKDDDDSSSEEMWKSIMDSQFTRSK